MQGSQQPPLLNVARFRETYNVLLNDKFVPQLARATNVDIRSVLWLIADDYSTEDLKVFTKSEQVDEAIKKALVLEPGRALPISLLSGVKGTNHEVETLAQNNLATWKSSAKDFPKSLRREINYIGTKKIDAVEGFTEAAKDEVVLSVAIYNQQQGEKVQEFLALGSTPLSALRDRIYCLSDHLLDGPVTTGGYFFIENCFYNDLGDPTAVNYSEPILKWASEDNRFTDPNLGLFASRSMDDTTFADLSVRLGVHYVYTHQGHCHHAIVFTALRMIHDQDNKNCNAYPLHVFQNRIRRKKCMVCGIYSARWVTFNDPVSSEDPTLYCDECYRPLHYSAEGHLLYNDYQVYPYYHE